MTGIFEVIPRIYAIGDIHGCKTELEKLLSKIEPSVREEDYIVFLGDYVDRGPDSKGVIDVVIQTMDTHKRTVALRGNHEEMMISGAWWMQNGGTETINSYGVNANDFYTIHNSDVRRCIPKNHWEFLNSLQYTFRLGRVVCVHASLNPDVPVESQSEEWMVWDRSMDGYNGSYKDDVFVVRGHTPNYKVRETENQLNIDTACVFGGHLTCAVIDSETGEVIEYHQVKSSFDY